MNRNQEQEQFDQALMDVIDLQNVRASQLLSIDGIYEILSEYYNNAVLDYLDDHAGE